jgi:hypothetical protein
MDTTVKVLDAALDVLRYGGWTRFQYGPAYDPRQPHCMGGAIDCVLGNNIRDDERGSRAWRALCVAGDHVFSSISPHLTFINDHLCQNFGDVEKVFGLAKEIAANELTT